MPTYEYRCPDGHDFERFFRKMSDAPAEVACPECGKIAERRMSAGAGLLFKGSGFYLTDYGKNAHRKGGETPESSESKSEGKTEAGSGSSESKSSDSSAAKADSKPSESKPAPAPAASTSKPTKSD